MAFEFDTVTYDVTDGIARVRMNRPESGNHLDAVLREELLQALLGASTDETVRLVVLSGEGEAFCRGIDPREIAALEESDSGTERRRSLQDEGRRLVSVLREMGKPVIAFVHGEAVGAGAALALACDIRIVTSSARFSFAFDGFRDFPDWGTTYFLPRLIGTGSALDLLWSGSDVDGSRAVALNLAQRLVDAGDPGELDDYLARVAALPALTTRLTAMAIHVSGDYDLSSMLDFESEASQQCWPSRPSR